MDIERGCLEILFSKISSEDIAINIEDTLTLVNNSYNQITKASFVFCANDVFKGYSGNELENIFSYMESRIKEANTFSDNGVFGFISQVAEEFLIYNESEPQCKYNQLLRWRDISFKLGQDIFTTAYLARTDTETNQDTKYFAYNPIIKTDNKRLNNILKQGIAENHFHLTGSTQIFALSWASLMNYIANRDKDFQKIYGYLNPKQYSNTQEHIKQSLYKKCIQASLIRAHLFALMKGEVFCVQLFEKILNSGLTSIDSLDVADIQRGINILNDEYGYKVEGKILDYAFEKEVIILPSNLKSKISKTFKYIKIFFTLSKDDEEDTPVAIKENSKNPYIKEYGHPLVSAHRAGAGIVPENTLMAFDLCLHSPDFEIDLFELDVHLTRDGELVVLHNSTFDATSNAVEAFGKKKIYPINYTIEQLQVLNLGENFEQNGKYPYRGLRGDNIPENLRVHKLDDILDYVNANAKKQYYFSIDVKNHGDLGRKAADRLYKVLGERNMYGNVVAASFNPSVSKYYDSNCPDMRRSAGPPEVLKFYFYSRLNADLKKYGVKYSLLQIPYGAYKKPNGKEIINLGTREFINYAHTNNIAVQYWTINNAGDMRKLRGNGCDCIMTDFPDMAYEELGKK